MRDVVFWALIINAAVLALALVCRPGKRRRMTKYRVIWEIDIEADTPLHAARQAREIQMRPNSHATVFDIKEGSRFIETVDLEEHASAI